MLIKTKDFKKTASAIELAISSDSKASDLELKVNNDKLFLNITNGEFFVSSIFDLENADPDFHAVVDGKSLLSLINSLSAESFDLEVEERLLKVQVGKSKYQFPLKIEGDSLKKINPIRIINKVNELTIKPEILQSILKVNGAEVKKAASMKLVKENPLHSMYYLTNEGCFNYSTGVCLNLFTLDSKINLLLNNRIVKLFKLFDTDATLTYGIDSANGVEQHKIVLTSENNYVASLITNDLNLNSSINSKFESSKRMINEPFKVQFSTDSEKLSEIVSRFSTYTKNLFKSVEPTFIPVRLSVTNNEVSLSDKRNNIDYLEVTDVQSDADYTITINLYDLITILGSCKNTTLTISFGDAKAIKVQHDSVIHLISKISDSYL